MYEQTVTRGAFWRKHSVITVKLQTASHRVRLARRVRVRTWISQEDLCGGTGINTGFKTNANGRTRYGVPRVPYSSRVSSLVSPGGALRGSSSAVAVACRVTPMRRRRRARAASAAPASATPLTVFTTRPTCLATPAARIAPRAYRTPLFVARAAAATTGSEYASVSAFFRSVSSERRSASSTDADAFSTRARRAAGVARSRARALRASLCALASPRLCPGPPRCPPCTLPPSPCP